ncbi:MAG TPA: TolC family protein [Lutibacter sp.]|nr:TolC family protein [Lutibacter sp.]
MKLLSINKKHIVLLLFMIGFQSVLSLQAQETLSLAACYTLAETNYPLQVKKGLLATQNEAEVAVISKQKLPKFELAAQATYQSDVVSLPFSLPNMEIEAPNQEQWKATFTASQLIYNGGLIDLQQNIKKAELGAKQQEIAVSFHQLKAQINSLYFSVLLLKQTKTVLEKNTLQIQEKITEIDKRIQHGVAPVNAADPLHVKLLELQQKIIEIDATQKQVYNKLGLLIGKHISNTTELSLPDVYVSQQIKRPEFALFDFQKEIITQNDNFLSKKNYPMLSAFGTGGVGNPGLNMLDNSEQGFYIVGLKAKWNVFDWGATKKQRQALAINKEIIDNQQQVFEWKQSIEAKTYLSDIEKNTSLIKSDKELIALHKKGIATASKQLKHDIITTADYTAEVNKLVQAEINLKTHEIQLELAKANYQITMFN